MSVRGAAPNFPSTRPGGPRFGNFANNSGFPPMGPNQNPQGMRGPPPPYQSPGQFDPSFMSSNPGGANRQNPMGPHMMGVPREMNPMQVTIFYDFYLIETISTIRLNINVILVLWN